MKNIFIIIAAIFIFSSCSKNKFEKKLIGNWSSTDYNNDVSEIRFYQDSLIIYEFCEPRLCNWKANNSKIKIKRILNKESKNQREFTLDYKLSKNNDSLFIKDSKDSIFSLPVFIKINNRFDHFQKSLKMKIDLPKTDSELISSGSESINFNIYVGYQNGKLIAKNDYKENLDNLMSSVISKRSALNEKEEKELKFNLLIDKSVPQIKIDSIKQILSEISKLTQMKMFRTYKNDTIDYSNLNWCGGGLEWFGNYE